jgi:UDP-N-acetylmuramoylalanine--D-glutamate ligase
MRLPGKSVAVVGLGDSGIAAAELCLRHGAKVTGFDEAKDLGAGARALVARGLPVIAGPLDERVAAVDVIVVSPGVPRRAPIDAAEAAGVEVISEVELASRFLETPIVLVGGTNGKSTTTALCHEMMLAAGKRSFVGGNYGTPLCKAVGEGYDVCVVELSSFQAERVPTLRARAHALLNITDDHLDRYDTFADYAKAKGNPFVNMTADDVAVVPQGDALCAAQAARGQARVVTFGGEGADVYVNERELVDLAGGRHPLAAIKLRGRHNLMNACSAAALAGAMGVASEAIGRALASFAGLPHRHVLCGEIDGVRYYDDSKATNVGAAVAALSGLDEARAVLIAGGRDKLGSYAPLIAALATRGRALVVLGEAAERIAEAAGDRLPVVRVASLGEAVRAARGLAEAGDAVLLSPACSSYDMFANYKERGDAFAAAVAELAKERA